MSFLQEIFLRLDQVADSSPHRAALYAGGETVTYGQLRAAIEVQAQVLLSCGVTSGDRVAILQPNSPEAYASILATVLLGASYVPLPPDGLQKRINELVADARVKVVIASRDLLPQAEIAASSLSREQPQLRVPVPDLFRFPQHKTWPVSLDTLRDDSALYLLYTSGSTGHPKGVRISSGNVANFIRFAHARFSISELDIFLGLPRLTFDLSVFNIFAPLFAGASVRLAGTPAEQMFPGTLFGKGVTIALTVPRITGLMLEAEQLKPLAYPRLRHIIFCGEPLHAAQVAAWRSALPALSVRNLYGPTETTLGCVLYSFEPGDSASDPIPIGKPLPGVVLEVEGGGEKGELIIAGVMVPTFGYWGIDTGKYFEHPKLGRAFRSGDLVRKAESGDYYWLARTDDQLKIRGYRVEPGEIELPLRRCTRISDLTCLYDPQHEEIVILACLKPAAEEDEARSELAQLARSGLPDRFQPEKYVFAPSLPRTANGKVDRVACRRIAGL